VKVASLAARVCVVKSKLPALAVIVNACSAPAAPVTTMRLGVAPTPVSTMRADNPRLELFSAATMASGVSAVGVTVVVVGLDTPVTMVRESALPPLTETEASAKPEEARSSPAANWLTVRSYCPG